jgi:NTP pyrophosphatase (non-canonical NTP hydrolase)
MAYKFYNIGRANAEIGAADAVVDAALTKAGIAFNVESPLAERISLLPTHKAEAAELVDALASNDEISTKISAVSAENTKLQASVTELTTAKTNLGSELTAVTSALTVACTQMGVGTDEEVAKLSNPDKVAKLQSSVVKAVAGIGIKPDEIPAASAGSANAPSKSGVMAKLEKITDPRERTKFIKANRSALFAAAK